MSYIKLRAIFTSLAIGIGLVSVAQSLEEAKEMYRAGDFAGALPVFLNAVKAKPRDASLNQWTGVCLMMEGQPQEAVPYLKFAHSKNVVEAPRYLAEIAFNNYDFEAADGYIDAYETALKKAKKSMSEEVHDLRRRVQLAMTMLDRVEKIVVIDSVNVDKDDFFRYYRLPAESGSISSPEVLPEGWSAADPTTVYMPQLKSFMMWAAPDENDSYVLMESNRLFDGTFDEPHQLEGPVNGDGDSNFPFMMSDGVTLYYANDGEGSIGGYDIFISRKDEDGYLQPQNVGMPYNSPYDDYLLAIDEENGVGWWATDRNRIDGKVTIYKFIPSELRVNYEVDTPGLTDHARLVSYRDTWEPGKDYSDLLAVIAEIDPDKKAAIADFYFALPGGKVYTTLDDFSNRRARAMMEKYLDSQRDLDAQLTALAGLRSRYRNGDHSVADEILRLEKSIEQQRIELKHSANAIITAEL